MTIFIKLQIFSLEDTGKSKHIKVVHLYKNANNNISQTECAEKEGNQSDHNSNTNQEQTMQWKMLYYSASKEQWSDNQTALFIQLALP